MPPSAVGRGGLLTQPFGGTVPWGIVCRFGGTLARHRPALWRNDSPVRPVVLLGRQAAVSNSGLMVRMGPMAVYRPTGQEAQTAAGPRGRRYLPKTARRCNWRAHFGQTGLKDLPLLTTAHPYRLACRPGALPSPPPTARASATTASRRPYSAPHQRAGDHL